MATMAAMPADADPLAGLPAGHAFADLFDHADDFVAGHPRIRDAGKRAQFGQDVTVTDPASLDLD